MCIHIFLNIYIHIYVCIYIYNYIISNLIRDFWHTGLEISIQRFLPVQPNFNGKSFHTSGPTKNMVHFLCICAKMHWCNSAFFYSFVRKCESFNCVYLSCEVLSVSVSPSSVSITHTNMSRGTNGHTSMFRGTITYANMFKWTDGHTNMPRGTIIQTDMSRRQ